VKEIQEKTASNAAYPRKFMENAAMQVHNFVQEQYPVKWYNFFVNDSQTMWQTTYINRE
jgi:NAD(P)H-hydrate repair Nnr-like enzyme with NAD(P)H-hydrate epimerase domain